MIGDKVIFASAHPFIEQADAIEIYKKLNISEEVREKVMYKTAAKILGLDKGRFPQHHEAHGPQRLQQRQVPAAVPALRPDGTLGFCGELRFRAVPWGGNAPRPARTVLGNERIAWINRRS